MGVTEQEKRRMFNKSVSSARKNQCSRLATPMSPTSSFMASTMNHTGFSVCQQATDRVGSHEQDFRFWQSDEIREQPRKRDDLQKRIAAYYQSIRNANGVYYQCVAPKNQLTNLWATTPIPSSCRHLNKRNIGKQPDAPEFKTSIRIRTNLRQEMAFGVSERPVQMQANKKEVAK